MENIKKQCVRCSYIEKSNDSTTFTQIYGVKDMPFNPQNFVYNFLCDNCSIHSEINNEGYRVVIF